MQEFSCLGTFKQRQKSHFRSQCKIFIVATEIKIQILIVTTLLCAELARISMAGFEPLSHVQIFSFVDKPPVNHWLI
jgi:hypothetical protein